MSHLVVFDRLNTGGVKANEMEVRNAIFRGKFTESLQNVTEFPDFCRLWNIPIDRIVAAETNGLYQQMDDLSIALRFFALYEPNKMEGPFKDYLGEFMEEMNRNYITDQSLEEKDKKKFEQAASNCWKVFGEDAFRNTQKEKKGPKSAPLADAVMIALAEVDPQKLTAQVIDKLRNGFNQLLTEGEFIKSISSGTNGKGSITKRIEMARKVVVASV